MSSSCPICSSIDLKICGKPKVNSISEKIIKKEFNVVQCRHCSVYFVDPEIDFTDQEWEMLYNTEYFSDQTNWLLKKREKELKRKFDKADKFINKSKDIKFLDIGAGEGKSLIEAVNRGWEVTGIDVVDLRINEAKREDIIFHKAKFLAHNLPQDYFDFIYLDSVLEHVLSPIDYLKKIKSLLKPGGVIYVGVPNEDSLFNDIRRLVFDLIGRKEISEKIKPFDQPYHVIGFNKKSLDFIVNETGLDYLLMRNFSRKFGFLGNRITRKGFWIDLVFLFPVEILGNILKKDYYYELYLTKKD